MGKEITQDDWGPENSGDQGSEGKGGGGTATPGENGATHYTDYSKNEPHEHHSWDEDSSGNVSNQHSTTRD